MGKAVLLFAVMRLGPSRYQSRLRALQRTGICWRNQVFTGVSTYGTIGATGGCRLPAFPQGSQDWPARNEGDRAMTAQQDVHESAFNELLGSIREDPLDPQTRERVRHAVEASCPTIDVARALYVGLEGVLATYWVALQEGRLRGDDDDFYKVVGMRRYVRTCYQDRDRLLDFLERDADFFEMLGRATSWVH